MTTPITLEIGPHLLVMGIVWGAVAITKAWKGSREPRVGDAGAAKGEPSARRSAGRPHLPTHSARPLDGQADPFTIVCAIVGSRYGVTMEQLRAPTRAQPSARARQVCMRLLRELTPLSYPQIGALFGRDHTTVIHALRATDGMLLEDLRDEARAALRPNVAEAPTRRRRESSHARAARQTDRRTPRVTFWFGHGTPRHHR